MENITFEQWLNELDKKGNSNFKYFQNLCYKYYQRHLYTNYGKLIEADDFVNDCAINVSKDWNKRDSEKGNIVTFIVVKINNTIHDVINLYSVEKRKHYFKYNTFTELNEDKSSYVDDDILFTDGLLITEDYFTKNDDEMFLINEVCKQIYKERDREVFKLYLLGCSADIISKKFNMSKPNVTRICKKIKDEFKSGFLKFEVY